MTVHTVNMNEDGLTRRQDLSSWIKNLQARQRATKLKRGVKKGIFKPSPSEIDILRKELDNLKNDVQTLKNVSDLRKLIMQLDKRVSDLEQNGVSFANSNLLNMAATTRENRKSIFKKIIEENVKLREKDKKVKRPKVKAKKKVKGTK